MIVALIVVMLILPPPMGQVFGALILGSAVTFAQSAPAPAPAPAPQPDCNCGVPDSPRGPR